jgi:fumarylacetoacetase
MTNLNETHEPELKSWLESANEPGTDFPIQNLPFGVFRRKDSGENFRGGVALGDQVIDLEALSHTGLLDDAAVEACRACSDSELNAFMSLGKTAWSALRLGLSRLFRKGSGHEDLLRDCLVSQTDVEHKMPCRIGDYTDFYTSIHHATNVGKQFRPDNPLLPNYQWIPIGYHGRASSIEVSGHSFCRPRGQIKAPDEDMPTLLPCKRLDYELELGIFIGSGNELGTSIGIDRAEDHVFGLCLFNDWSARDIQAWEYQPLGPFLSKSFASTVSPWIITMEALAPFRTAWTRPEDHPQPLPYLESEANREQGAMDIQLEVLIQTGKMWKNGEAAVPLSTSSFRHSYWTVAQMVAHHTVNGCNLMPGDFFGSGTQSGPEEGEQGSMLELSRGGKEPLTLPNAETRTFLEDGDCIVLKGRCQSDGAVPIGFGEAMATILPSV